MRHVISSSREQSLLLPPCMDDWIARDHPVRYIAQFVDQMDLVGAGLDTLNRQEGGKAHDPSLLLATWLYGYHSKIRSTRELENACRENMAFIWLTGNTRPDHNSLWRYWNSHREQLAAVFHKTLKVAVELKLVDFVTQALDGTKIPAACSKENFDRKKLDKLLLAVAGEIAGLEQQIAAAGNQPAPRLAVELQTKAGLRSRLQAALARVEKGESKSVNPGEVDATLMSRGPAYNAQALSAAGSQIIVAADVGNEISDQGQALPMLEQARANLRAAIAQAAPAAAIAQAAPAGASAQVACANAQAAPANASGQALPASAQDASASAQDARVGKVRTLADGGYASAQNFHDAVSAGHDLLTPPPSSWRDLDNPCHSAHFRLETTAGGAKRMVCPAGRHLSYERRRVREGRALEIYGKRGECDGCEMRAQCTRSETRRQVEIPVEGYEELRRRRAEWEEAEVKEAYKKRAGTVEPVFAQIKNVGGFRRWTVKGLEKVRVQWRMLCASWNLKVLIRRWRESESCSGPSCAPA